MSELYFPCQTCFVSHSEGHFGEPCQLLLPSVPSSSVFMARFVELFVRETRLSQAFMNHEDSLAPREKAISVGVLHSKKGQMNLGFD